MVTSRNLELVYYGKNGAAELPLEDWQYAVIAQVLGLSIQEDSSGISVSYFPKDFVVERIKKMGILVPTDSVKKT